MSTYTKRSTEVRVIKEVGDGWVSTDLWSISPSQAVMDRLAVGKTVVLETRGSEVVGWLIDGEWVERKSDEDLAREHQEFVRDLHRRRQEYLDTNREDWTRREAALPDWIRGRLARFRSTEEEPGSFDREGWGYELVIAELAVLYDANGLDDDAPEIGAYARSEGTSGNQHGMAKALAGAHREGVDLTGTVSALSPITGKAGY